MVNNNMLDDLITEAVNQDNCNNKCIDIARCIESRNSELIKLVEKLQPALTDKDPTKRERGTHVLADVLRNLPFDFLKESELITLANFFCDRLKDHAVVIPSVLQGILAMVGMKNLPRDAPAVIVRMVFQQIQCQTLKQDERNVTYKIFQTLIHKYTEELKQLGTEFVMGFITMIDGERDPRNLLLIFGMLPHFLRTFPPGLLIEDMFEVMACYFPVDFYSDPNDTNKITRDTLAAALQPCLVAVPDFAEFCIPLLLEKLDSQLRVAKLDSLRVLQCGCRTFTLEGMEKFLGGLYQSLNREMIPGTDKEVCKEALTALTELVHMLSNVPIDKDQAKQLHTMLEKVIKDGIQFLNDVEFSSFLPAARMLVAVAEASPAACEAVITEIVPVLVSQFHKRSTDSEGKVVLLQTLSTFVAVCERLQVTPTRNSELSPLWTNISNIYLAGAQHQTTEVQREGIHGFLISVKSVHSDIRSMLYDILCNFVKHEDSFQVRQEVIACLKEYSRLYPDEILENVVFSKLRCSQVSESGDAEDSSIQSRCLDALCEIAVVEPFTTCIVPQILDFVAYEEPQTEKCVTRIKCLRKLVEMPDAGTQMHKYLYVQCAAVARLVSWWLCGLCENTHPQIFHNENLLIDSAKVISTILRSQSNSVQFEVVTEFTPRFLEPHPISEGNDFKPLDTTSPWHQTQAVLLLEALLSPIQQDVNIPQLSELITKLVTLSIHTSHPLTSKSAARLVACLINKAEDTESLSTLLSELLSLLAATPDEPNTSTNEAFNAITLFSWITKALIMRTHKDTDNWTENLIYLLNHKSIGSKAADGFRLIMVQEEEYINEHNYCNIRLLYRQRFFQIVPKLVEAYHMADDDVKINYLSALAFLLQGAPKIVLSTSLPEMVPLLVESLGQTDVVLLLTCLETLIDPLEFKQQILQDHINTFLPKFLLLSRFQDSMMVRIKALKCLLQVCNFPIHIILPFKHQTIRELGMCLDDPKRLVRRQAVITRSRWFLIGAPGDSHDS